MGVGSFLGTARVWVDQKTWAGFGLQENRKKRNHFSILWGNAQLLMCGERTQSTQLHWVTLFFLLRDHEIWGGRIGW